MSEGRDERSLGDLFAELAQETSTLVRQEVKLAETELSQKAVRVGQSVGSLVLGGAVLYAGVLTLIAAVIIVLGELGLPWWLAALLVGVVAAGAGALLVARAYDALKRIDPVPHRTIESLKEDQSWAKEQVG